MAQVDSLVVGVAAVTSMFSLETVAAALILLVRYLDWVGVLASQRLNEAFITIFGFLQKRIGADPGVIKVFRNPISAILLIFGLRSKVIPL